MLKPGEETKLVIDWKAGAAPDRAFRHGGPVYTNDPENAEVNFTVEGAIDMPVEVLPNLWSVGNISLDKTGTFRAAIGSRLTDQLEVESVESPSGKVNVRVSPDESRRTGHGKMGEGVSVWMSKSPPTFLWASSKRMSKSTSRELIRCRS